MASKTKVIDWGARHSPVTGTANAAFTALALAAVGQQTGLPGSWVLGASTVGALGSLINGASREPRPPKSSLVLRASAWLAAGGWTTYALHYTNVWAWDVVAPLLATACGFGAAGGALSFRARKKAQREAEVLGTLFRVATGNEWADRFARVAHVQGCEILGVSKWKDDKGVETGAGFTLEVKMPPGGASWRTLAQHADAFASDANLPEGCGVEVFSGAGRGLAIVKVSTSNSLLDTLDVPLDASELDFHKPFDIGIKRDSGLATIDIREFSAMLVGDKRTGKTNELQTIITRLTRMPNLLIWVIDFNGGGVALPWLQAWDELGRPGRPPIDWVASTDREAAMMANAAVRIAKARKIKYQRHMREQNTDLLPLTAEIPGIVIITDEGAEIYADPRRRNVSDPMKEVIRIAGAVGINQVNCFLRATADVTGDTIIKSQSRARIGMRMAQEEDIAYLFGWKCGVKPEDMPDRGYGAVSMDPTGAADIFRGWRTLPDAINWFTKNTAKYRQNAGLDQISREEAGPDYEGRWSEERSGYIFSGKKPPQDDSVPAGAPQDEETLFGGSALTPEQAVANLKKAIADNGGPSVEEQNQFEQVLQEAGVTDWGDPSQWPDGQRPAQGPNSQPEDEEAHESAEDNLRAVVFGMVKAIGPDGIGVQEICDALTKMNGSSPQRQTITRWLREDDRIYKPKHGKYAVKPDDTE